MTIEISTQRQRSDGTWQASIPEPYYWGLLSWMWKRLTGWRDSHGRKAQLFWE